MTWLEWKRTNARKIAHPHGYEERFVDTVLSRISAIDPDDVVPQYDFVDEHGKNRRIDFMIVNPSKGYLLPIELDGAKKAEHEDWDDFLARQNSLVRSFGKLLRYSNLQMKNTPGIIIQQITDELALQATNEAMRKARISPAIEIHAPAKLPLPQACPLLPPAQSPAVTQTSKQIILQDVPLDRKPNEVVAQSARITPPDSLPAIPNPDLGKSSSMFKGVAISAVIAAVVIFGYAIRDNNASTAAVREDLPQMLTSQQSITPSPAAQPLRSDPAWHKSDGPEIQTSEVHHFIGQRRIVCGTVSGSREMSTGLFINFDKPFPNNTMSIVVWREHVSKMSRLRYSEGQYLCVFGEIQSYRGKPQIEVDDRDQITYF